MRDPPHAPDERGDVGGLRQLAGDEVGEPRPRRRDPRAYIDKQGRDMAYPDRRRGSAKGPPHRTERASRPAGMLLRPGHALVGPGLAAVLASPGEPPSWRLRFRAVGI